MDTSRRIQATSPFVKGKGTNHQRTNQQALMVMAVMLSLVLIAQVDRAKRQSLFAASAPLEQQHYRIFSSTPLEQYQHPVASSVVWSKVIFLEINLAIYQTHTMPRARGKPRKGAAWYMAESQRQRKKKFEKAIAMAAIRRRTEP